MLNIIFKLEKTWGKQTNWKSLLIQDTDITVKTILHSLKLLIQTWQQLKEVLKNAFKYQFIYTVLKLYQQVYPWQ